MTTENLVLKVDSTQVDKGAKSLDQLTASGTKAEKATDALTSTTAKANTALAGYAGMLAGAALTATVALVKSVINAADAMNDLHLKTGLAFESLAAYDQLARQSGTSTEGVAQGFKFLGKYMTEHSDKLKAIGVTSKDANVAMGQFADVIAGIHDPALRTTLAMTVLGRSGQDLIPLLLGGSAAFSDARESTKAYGEALARVAPEADKLNDKWEVLKTGAKTSALVFVDSLMPALQSITDQMVKAQKEYGTLAALLMGAGAGALKLLGVEIDPQKRAQAELNKLIAEQRDLQAEIARKQAQGAETGSLKARMDELRGTIRAQIDYTHSLEGTAGAEAAAKRDSDAKRSSDKAVADMLGKKAEEYAKLKKHADDYIKSLQKEAEQYGLTAAQKDMMDAATIAVTLHAGKEREAFMASALAAAMQTQVQVDAAKAKKAATKAEEELQKQLESGTEAYNKYWNSVDESTAKINENAAKLEFENSLIGKTAEEISRLTGVRDDEAIAVLEGSMALVRANDDKASEVTAIALQIEALYRLKAAREQKPQLEAAAKQVEEETKMRVDMWKSVDSVARDTFVNIWGHGKSTLDRLKDTLKNGLLAMLYEMGKKQFLINVGVTGAGVGASGMANAGGMGSALFGMAGQSAAFMGGISSAMSMGIVDGFMAGVPLLTSGMTGGISAGLGLMLPAVGIIAGGVALLSNLIKGNGGTPGTNVGAAYTGYSPTGAVTSQGSWAGLSPATNQAGVQMFTDTMNASYRTAAASLGITAASTIFSLSQNLGKDSKAPQFAIRGGAQGGGQFFSDWTPQSDAAMQLAASRAVFTALQGSDLPAYLSNLFSGLTADTASQAQIDGVLAFAASLKQLRDGLTETRTPLEVARAQMATLAGDLLTSASTFKTDFVAAIDAGITPETLGKWQQLGVLIDQTTQAQVTAAEEQARIVAEAAAKEAAVMQERLSWQQKLDILLGKTTQQEIDRAALLAGATDETTKLIMKQVFAEQDRQAALSASTVAVQTATTAIQAMVDTLSVGWGDIANSAQGAVDTVMGLTNFSGAKFTTRSSAQMTALQELIANSQASLRATPGDPGHGAERLRLEETIRIARERLGGLTADMARYVTLEAQYAGHGEQLLSLEKWYNEQKTLFEQNHLSTNDLQKEYERQRLEIIKSGNAAALDSMKQLKDWLIGLGGNGGLSPLTPAQQKADAEKQYNADLLLAQGGDAAAIGRLSREAEAVLAAQKAITGFGGDYSAIYNRIRAEIEALVGTGEGGGGATAIQPMMTEGNKTAADSLTELKAVRAELAETRATLARLLERGNGAVVQQTAILGNAINTSGDKQASATRNTAALAQVN